MFQAIETKYLGPTNFRGARVKAMACAGSKIYDWDHALDVVENHRAAALKFMVSKDWAEKYSIVGGQLASGNYAWIQQRRGTK